jgi:hypothetical protein
MSRNCRRVMTGVAALAIALVVGIGAGNPACAEDAPMVGKVTKSRPAAGSVFAGSRRTLIEGDDVHRSERIWTGSGGRIRLALNDGGSVDLGENARLALDDFVLPQEGAGHLVIRSASGAFRFTGGAIDKSGPGAVKVVTPLTTMTIRGTDFFAGPIDGAYGVFVFHGRVEVATAGGSVTLADGEGTSVTQSNAAPGPIKRWPAAKIARAEALVGF